MPTFNADQIIDKTLIAKVNIPIYRYAEDGAPVVYNVNAGSSVGVVYSYLMPSSKRTNLFWMFKDQDGRFYYTEHKAGIYDISALQQQGALTSAQLLQQQQQAAAAAADANLPLTDKIFRLVKNIAFIGAGALLINTLINKKL
jgi:hypothetical protein